MNQIARELDEKSESLGPARARTLESLVREANRCIEQTAQGDSENGWPPGCFEQTAGALAGERFERPSQGDMPIRDDW